MTISDPENPSLLYARLMAESAAVIEALPPAPLAERFYSAIDDMFTRCADHRAVLGEVFGGALRPGGGSVPDGATAALLKSAFSQMVERAADAPKGEQAAQFATLVYGMHLALMLFWLYDRMPQQAAARELLKFLREVISMMRTASILPPVSRSVARLAAIFEAVFGGVNGAT